ncbi:hypothetical protein CDV36_007647, partial [Fusarium kuroshium]
MARTRVRGLSRVRGMAWASMTTPEDGRPSVEWERLGSSGARSTTWCIKPTDDSPLMRSLFPLCPCRRTGSYTYVVFRSLPNND